MVQFLSFPIVNGLTLRNTISSEKNALDSGKNARHSQKRMWIKRPKDKVRLDSQSPHQSEVPLFVSLVYFCNIQATFAV